MGVEREGMNRGALSSIKQRRFMIIDIGNGGLLKRCHLDVRSARMNQVMTISRRGHSCLPVSVSRPALTG